MKLEIDENIINSQLLVEGNKAEELQTLFPSSSINEKAATIKPQPGICVKAKDGTSKVFLNICTSDVIPEPEDISESELIAILDSDEASDFRIPMSIGQGHKEKDKGGAECMAYDVVINPKFFIKMSDDLVFHNFFMLVTMEGLEQKYSMTLDKKDWVVLKNKKYHGKMPDQTVRTKLPLVQELSGIRQWKAEDLPPSELSSLLSSNPTEPLIKEISTKTVSHTESEKVKPEFVIKCLEGKENIDTIILEAEINLPDIATGKNIQVDIGEDRIVVVSSKHFLDIFVPHKLDTINSKAWFISSTQVLVLHLPVQN